MNEKVDDLKKLIESLKESEQRALYTYLRERFAHPLEAKWGLTADVILGAIDRSPDITQRGVRGIVAEAVFESKVLPSLSGWESLKVEKERPYDFKLKERGGHATITVQVKLQRSEKNAAKRGAGLLPKKFFIVEVQKTRSGRESIKPAGKAGETVEVIEKETRPYSFGDFNLLAVNMHPSTNDWSRFMYTVGAWLIPREENPALIEIMQPVSETRNDVWTDNLEEAIAWLTSGEKRLVYDLTAARAERAAAKAKPAAMKRRRNKASK